MAETVNHPAHYTAGEIECIDVIEAWGFGFNLGNALKYMMRAGRKPDTDPVEDLKKALWYLEREIKCKLRQEPQQTELPLAATKTQKGINYPHYFDGFTADTTCASCGRGRDAEIHKAT